MRQFVNSLDLELALKVYCGESTTTTTMLDCHSRPGILCIPGLIQPGLHNWLQMQSLSRRGWLSDHWLTLRFPGRASYPMIREHWAHD